jgi:hypothetical protein
VCTKAHDELNVRPCHREVQEGVNHALVLSLVNGITVLVRIQRRGHAHRSLHGLALRHVELLHQIFRVIGLMYEDAFLRVLYLNT